MPGQGGSCGGSGVLSSALNKEKERCDFTVTSVSDEQGHLSTGSEPPTVREENKSDEDESGLGKQGKPSWWRRCLGPNGVQGG